MYEQPVRLNPHFKYTDDSRVTNQIRLAAKNSLIEDEPVRLSQELYQARVKAGVMDWDHANDDVKMEDNFFSPEMIDDMLKQ
jgi:hypothetical protein